MITFGPVPSRRLGQRIFHLKNGSYDCVYCQVGPTALKALQRRPFYEPDEIVKAVKQRVEEMKTINGQIDFLRLVPDGEPNLDIHLGKNRLIFRL